MIKFVIRKMQSKKWMMLSLLIGSILLIAFALANPIYTETALKRTLVEDFNTAYEQDQAYPATLTAKSTSVISDNKEYLEIAEKMQHADQDFKMPVKEYQAYYFAGMENTKSDLEREDRSTVLSPASLTKLSEHVDLLEGTMYQKEVKDGVLDVVITPEGMQYMRVLLGETVTFDSFKWPDGSPLKLRISGVVTPKRNDPYWVHPSSYYYNALLMDEDVFIQTFMQGERGKASGEWNTLFDYSYAEGKDVRKMLSMGEQYLEEFQEIKSANVQVKFTPILETFSKKEMTVRTTFTVLQVPVYLLLIVFIVMVSLQLVSMEQGEIAVLKSRGASKKQIFTIYFVQSILISLISLPIGFLLALLLSRFLSAADGFLTFDLSRKIVVVMPLSVIIYAAAAVVINMLSMLIPVLTNADKTIVNHKQKKHRKSDKPFYEKFFLDVVFVLISLYGLYSFNSQKALLFERVLKGQSLDPLLFLSASLFMLGAGLLVLRILPYLTRLIYVIFKKKLNPALYTSFLHVIRTRKAQSLITVFLVMTIALGVFNASSARTINASAERNLRYANGADLVLKEFWQSNAALVERNPEIDLAYTEPDFERYVNLPGVESATRVYRNEKGTINLRSGSLNDVIVMGIHTKEFGQTAWFEDDLLGEHWYTYLNAMSRRTDAVLVSSNLKEYGYELNDYISYRSSEGSMIRGVIYGFVDYFPGYQEKEYKRDKDGLAKEIEQYLVVGNLAMMQEEWGVYPYEIWIKNEGNSDYIYDFIEENNIKIASLHDTEKDLADKKQDAVYESTNGLFSVGFSTSIVLLMVGFLIYWILSVKNREMQFGIFRAMGMSFREIIEMLVNEQIFISGISVLAGIFVGILTAKLYVPLIQIAYSSEDQALPLRIISSAGDWILVLSIIGSMIAVCLIILSIIIKKMKITQALKLGED